MLDNDAGIPILPKLQILFPICVHILMQRIIEPSLWVCFYLVHHLDENDNPISDNMTPDGKKCVWRYEVEGLWSTVVIFTLLGIIIVFLLLLTILIVYTQKRRATKRSNLAKSLIQSETPAI